MLPSDFGFFGSLGVWGVPPGPIFLVTQGAGQPRGVPPMWLDVIMTVMQVRPPRAWFVMPCAINEPLGRQGGKEEGGGGEGREKGGQGGKRYQF